MCFKLSCKLFLVSSVTRSQLKEVLVEDVREWIGLDRRPLTVDCVVPGFVLSVDHGLVNVYEAA